ncbi:hypothetical protein HUZ36_12750 [Pseudoalteromonas sp. McH1-7]|uniref:Uncharacterized protein n=1 Tax=Pseudoalteromonas peptidolytica F12-50-A1 TaxID=1315280 RepID=A0A8I0MSK2_9GAMM|nr:MULTISPECIES: hypothetical protein [Pseudoalteromonas]MBE0344636.1 hypothetical protein [Pseudoalteromonas peptidolytica F12-50-A1]MDW7550982.1 hypothetical protein [Pseudoalteromonas peptidolytica]NLR15228.1 hypothetical protein [Pseudoalteromonas peptidolytica]NUZ11648.1 hypothetical protein [Pseudoalteromonas sp. McH1-7]RXE94941.1 hypothetical protein D9603_21190 [Pseudoalteromonas sp. PS5]
MLKLKLIKKNLKQLNDKAHIDGSMTKKIAGGNTDGIKTTSHISQPEPDPYHSNSLTKPQL